MPDQKHNTANTARRVVHHPACQTLPRMLQRARPRLSFVGSLFIGVGKAVVVVVRDGDTLPGLPLLAFSLCPLFPSLKFVDILLQRLQPICPLR